MATARKKIGRPSKYPEGFSASYAEMARKLCLLGLTKAEMCATLSISESTYCKWINAHPEFKEACQEGRVVPDAEVAARLFQRTQGYEYEETQTKIEGGKKTVTVTRKQVAPDVAACIFWLKNRQPKLWRDKIEAGLTDKDGNDVPQMDPNEAARRIAFALANAAKAMPPTAADS